MRLFFALWPPRETAEALARWAAELEGRATPLEKIHLTLAFLGGAEPERAIEAARLVRGNAFPLPIDAARYVPRNEMVWVGPKEMPDGLKALVSALHAELHRVGFTLERRPFAAHVTLLRRAPKPKALSPLPRVHWPVREFALVSSDLSAYETLARFRLDS